MSFLVRLCLSSLPRAIGFKKLDSLKGVDELLQSRVAGVIGERRPEKRFRPGHHISRRFPGRLLFRLRHGANIAFQLKVTKYMEIRI